MAVAVAQQKKRSSRLTYCLYAYEEQSRPDEDRNLHYIAIEYSVHTRMARFPIRQMCNVGMEEFRDRSAMKLRLNRDKSSGCHLS